jgi:SLOG in TRPM, prokaryote
VVDGGTDAGVMRLMGRARAETGAAFPLVGVAAAGTISLPGVPPPRPDAAPLEPNHTHFVLVPGSTWGDEARWLARVASALAAGAPSVTVLVDGGETAWEDAAVSVEAGRPVIAVSGSGRAADTLVGAIRGEASDGRARELAISGLLRAADLSAESLAGAIEEALSAKE